MSRGDARVARPLGAVPPAGSTARPAAWRVWLRAVRVFSFTASVVPILVGSALAVWERAFDPLLFAAMLVASVACHAGSNLANDYGDHLRGADDAASLGPSGVIQAGWLTPAQVRTGMLVAFGAATLLGLGIVAATGPEVFVLALLCLGAAYFYTAGPRPLAYVALGEATVFLAMGPAMVVGACYVLTGRVTAAAVLASLPVGLLVAAILHANNVRDLVPDRAAGKVTLANRFGKPFADREYAVLVGGAYPAVLLLVAVEPGLWPTLAVFLTAPTALGLIRAVRGTAEPAALNGVLRRTAGLHLRFGVVLAAGVLVGAVVGAVVERVG